MTIAAGSEYVALGSSFAAGPGLKPRAAGAARRSGRSDSNYAHIVARRLDLRLVDVSYSGATIAQILSDSGPGSGQLAAITSATRLVTITGGGNDIGYLPALTLASLRWPFRVFPVIRHRVTDLTDRAATDARFTSLNEDLRTLIDQIRHRAPGAEIVMVGYLTILEPRGAHRAQPSTARSPLSAHVTDWAHDAARRLGETLGSVAKAEGCLFVDVGALSRDHHAWSAQPWTRRFHLSLRGGAPYHPNAAGMQAVAEMVVRAIRP